MHLQASLDMIRAGFGRAQHVQCTLFVTHFKCTCVHKISLCAFWYFSVQSEHCPRCCCSSCPSNRTSSPLLMVIRVDDHIISTNGGSCAVPWDYYQWGFVVYMEFTWSAAVGEAFCFTLKNSFNKALQRFCNSSLESHSLWVAAFHIFIWRCAE